MACAQTSPEFFNHKIRPNVRFDPTAPELPRGSGMTRSAISDQSALQQKVVHLAMSSLGVPPESFAKSFRGDHVIGRHPGFLRHVATLIGTTSPTALVGTVAQ
jgi:hypothetical protein